MSAVCFAVATALLVASTAHADDEVTVRTTTGALFRGEIVESIPNDHIVIRVPTGSLHRVAWNEVIRAPLAEREPDAPPFEIVRTIDGSVYIGEVVEKIRDDHIALKNATGAIRFIRARDIDPNAAPVAKAEEREETVRTIDGSEYCGVLIERVVGEHVVVRVRTGALRTIPWRELDLYPPPPIRRAPDVETVHTSQGNEFHGDVIERVFQHHIVLKLPSGDLKSIAWDDLVFPSERKRSYEDWLADSKHAEKKHTIDAGAPVTSPAVDDDNPSSFGAGICVGVGFSLLFTGIPLFALGGQNSLGLDVAGGIVSFAGLALVVAGFAYNAVTSARHHRLSLVDQ